MQEADGYVIYSLGSYVGDLGLGMRLAFMGVIDFKVV